MLGLNIFSIVLTYDINIFARSDAMHVNKCLYAILFYRFKVDMSEFPTISRLNANLKDVFEKAHPDVQPDCPAA